MMKTMTPATLSKLYANSGYTDMKYYSCKFKEFYFGVETIEAIYEVTFDDNEGSKVEGYAYVIWDGKNISAEI